MTDDHKQTEAEPVAMRRLTVTNGPVAIRERADGRADIEAHEPYYTRENLERLQAAIRVYLSQPQDARPANGGAA